MGYAITFLGAPDQHGQAETFFLCSIGSWGRFVDWALALPEDDYPALHGLAQSGSWDGTDALAADLEDALADHAPEDAGVRATAAALQEHLGVGDPDETAVVSEGETDEADAEAAPG
jgi:hypothetical protein